MPSRHIGSEAIDHRTNPHTAHTNRRLSVGKIPAFPIRVLFVTAIKLSIIIHYFFENVKRKVVNSAWISCVFRPFRKKDVDISKIQEYTEYKYRKYI